MQLVQNYPEHDFFIDADEARNIGLDVQDASSEQRVIFDRLMPHLDRLIAIGRVES